MNFAKTFFPDFFSYFSYAFEHAVRKVAFSFLYLQLIVSARFAAITNFFPPTEFRKMKLFQTLRGHFDLNKKLYNLIIISQTVHAGNHSPTKMASTIP